jgi:hypothetical protein
MESAKNVRESKIFCWDCKRKIELDNKKIKNGFLLTYEKEGEKFSVFKCKDCFEKSKELKNFQPCEVYSRIVGYLRPVQQWNLGKQEEFKERKNYKIKRSLKT